MRLFQNFDIYPDYLARLHATLGADAGHAAFLDRLHDDRVAALHMLAPTLERRAEAAFAVGRDLPSQRAWAAAAGLKRGATREDILLAQIEDHRTEIFYNSDPVRFDSAFVRRLPGHVRRAIAWRAAPSGDADFTAHDLVVCNFPGILAGYRAQGMATAWFAPGHDPAMDAHARPNEARDIDLLFVGTYSRHHRRRAATVERLAAFATSRRVALHLQCSRLTRLAETPAGAFGPLRRHRRPAAIRAIAAAPLYGRALYEQLGRARIVVNGAIDMAGTDRGNMRCWEAMGTGALLLTDPGDYPAGMEDGRTMATYASDDAFVARIETLCADEPTRRTIAARGRDMIRERYSKARQWADFQALVS